MRPEWPPARSDGRHLVDGVMRQRHQHVDPEHERQPQAQQAVVEKSLRSLALKASPYEQAGEKEHEMHQVDVLGSAEQIETKPAFGIEDWKRLPVVRRAIERRRQSGLRAEIGKDGVKCHHNEDDKTAKINE